MEHLHPYASRSETGPVAEHNEDRVLAHPEAGLWIVADGMGGHAAGEIASEVVIEAIEAAVSEGQSLSEAVQHAHHAIKYAADNGRGEEGMGSTVVVLRLDGDDYQLAWVGDSRAYLWNPPQGNPRQGSDPQGGVPPAGGRLIQLSHDHSFVQRLVDSGNLTDEEARVHPHRNIITQSLGALDMDNVDVATVRGRLFRGQRILLCSDGLTDVLDDEEVSALLRQSEDIQQQVDALVEEVIGRQGRDNVSVQIISASDRAPLAGRTGGLHENAFARLFTAPWQWKTLLVVGLLLLLLFLRIL